MKNRYLIIAAAILLASCHGSTPTQNAAQQSAAAGLDSTANMANISTTDATYKADSATCISYIAYDKSKTGPRPVVLVIPEWWGLDEYPKMRARELAKLGYFAMAVDMYGGGQIGTNPDEAGKLAGAFYKDSALVKSRLNAALAKAMTYAEADKNKVAMIGYCFGGSMALMGAKMHLPLRGVVSFHGGLKGTAAKTIPILICHGEADKMVKPEEVTAWRRTMDSLGAPYTFKSYPGATHAFTNPAATANGKKFSMPIEYNAAADTASWKEMKQFFSTIF